MPDRRQVAGANQEEPMPTPATPDHRRSGRSTMARLVLAAGTAAVGTLGTVALAAAPASAATAPTCTAVESGQDSGWCALYPGDATGNVQELGDVAVSLDGSTLTVQTQSASTGTVPDTSFACLLESDPGRTRMQQTLCAQAGGVWIPFSGGAVTIDLTQYPQFSGTTFTVQVAANQDANSANGDAFYNNVAVSDTTGSISYS
jgi:hypothetical protein